MGRKGVGPRLQMDKLGRVAGLKAQQYLNLLKTPKTLWGSITKDAKDMNLDVIRGVQARTLIDLIIGKIYFL